MFGNLSPVEKLEGEDDFQWCLHRLETHFAPKQNVCVERCRFRKGAAATRGDHQPVGLRASPVLRARDGVIRLCVDMRRVNQVVITDGHPLRRIEDVLDRLRGSLMFSRLDLKDAYHQLELQLESQDLATFVSHKGLYRFRLCRVNFGLASAGPCFQRVMTSMLEGIPGMDVYLDDIIIHAVATVISPLCVPLL